MKNKIKFYNIIIILCTIITVTILIYIYRIQDYIYPYNEVITEVKEDKYINNLGLNEDNEKETEKIKEEEINEKSLEDSEEEKREKEVIKEKSLSEHK
ncbi:hypothetical protein, partial [Clostridium sp.]|uniref:hypothetical protein n=1 Tax=Clostridium sp. TaxID=1506 RepID=UPI003463AB68